MEDADQLPEEIEEPRSVRLRRSFLRLGLALLAVSVIGLMSGYLFATSNPQSASAARIGAFVRVEPAAAAPDGIDTWDPAAPTSGDERGAPGCGIREEPLPPGDQVAALAAGRVLVQYRPADVAGDAVAALHDVAGDHQADVVLAPNPDLAAEVVATAWSRRMVLRSPEPDLLDGFATAFAGEGPAPTPCTRP